MRMTTMATALTPNSLLNSCKRKLGISTFPLPYPDSELLDILYQDTLPTFSKFYPRYATIRMNLNELPYAKYATDEIPKVSFGRRAYHLDLTGYGTDLAILDIEDVKCVNSDLSDYRTYNVGFQDGYEILTGAFAQAQMDKAVNAPIVFFFEAPDLLIIDEPGILNRGMVSITFLLLHAFDLSTIKLTYKDKLTELYMIDLKLNLYPVLKHMDKIDTSFGQIDLKIDDWDNMDDKRKELVQYWEQHFLSHRRTKLLRK